jgi:hypothetical protein
MRGCTGCWEPGIACDWLQREFGAKFQSESGVWISVNERVGGSSQQVHEV